MEMAYLICAVVGSVILLAQTALTLFGMDAHPDVDVAADLPDDLETGEDYLEAGDDASWFFELLSFRSVMALLAFFGLGGLAGQEAGFGAYFSFVLASSAGVAAMVAVAWLMRLLYRLKSDGTVSIFQTVGHNGTVYLSIPGEKRGAGKVTINVYDRSVEYEAVTAKKDLPTGANIQVIGVVGPNTVEVESTDLPESK